MFMFTVEFGCYSPFNPVLYGNRALCYLKMGEYKSVNLCTQDIDCRRDV